MESMEECAYGTIIIMLRACRTCPLVCALGLRYVPYLGSAGCSVWWMLVSFSVSFPLKTGKRLRVLGRPVSQLAVVP